MASRSLIGSPSHDSIERQRDEQRGALFRLWQELQMDRVNEIDSLETVTHFYETRNVLMEPHLAHTIKLRHRALH